MIQSKVYSLIELFLKAYAKFNKEVFNGDLPDAVINIAYLNNNKKNGTIYGQMAANGAFVDSDDNYAEDITISPKVISLGFEDTMLTLLHEMIHIYNKQHKIEDVNKQGKHNEKFKESAEKFGVSVEKDKYVGWTTNILAQEHYKIVSNIPYDKKIFDLDYELTNIENDKNKDKNNKPKKIKFKHSCPNNHFKPFKLNEMQDNLKCSICGEPVLIEEVKPKNK